VYQGIYGPWQIEQEDLWEVWGYRVALSTAAAAFVAVAAVSLTTTSSSSSSDTQGLAALLNPLCLLGSGGLGVALILIHIYVTPIKRTLQALWGLGFAGGLYLMSNQEPTVPEFICNNPWGVWLVGPLFAAATGVAVKEGICYGKAEAAVIALLLPLLLLGHLSHLAPAESPAGHFLLVTTSAAVAVFAGRKYTQPVKDDIGDKSVFMFRKLPEEEQKVRIQQLQQQMGPADD